MEQQQIFILSHTHVHTHGVSDTFPPTAMMSQDDSSRKLFASSRAHFSSNGFLSPLHPSHTGPLQPPIATAPPPPISACLAFFRPTTHVLPFGDPSIFPLPPLSSLPFLAFITEQWVCHATLPHLPTPPKGQRKRWNGDVGGEERKIEKKKKPVWRRERHLLPDDVREMESFYSELYCPPPIRRFMWGSRRGCWDTLTKQISDFAAEFSRAFCPPCESRAPGEK